MSNIYVSPVAAPSFERLSAEAHRPANEFTSTNDEGIQLQKLDENANEVFVDSTKTKAGCQPCDNKEELGELRQTVVTKSPNLVGKIITGDAFETPSGTITTLHLSTGTEDSGSPPSPLYCFHSFTYGAGESNENEAGNEPSVKNSNVFEDKSYDADSPNVLHTRMVVDSEENGSPTFRYDWNWGDEGGELSNDSVSSKETGNADSAEVTYTGFQNPEDASSTSSEGESSNGKAPKNSEQEENENSREKSCKQNETKVKVNIRRLSPEGAEYFATDRADICLAIDGDTTSYLMVPDKRLVAEAQRRDTLGSSLGRSPSGRMDDKDYWTLDDALEGTRKHHDWCQGRRRELGREAGSADGKEVVDDACQDRVPLLHPGKPRLRYTTENEFEEMEEGVTVPCFPCGHCVIL